MRRSRVHHYAAANVHALSSANGQWDVNLLRALKMSYSGQQYEYMSTQQIIRPGPGPGSAARAALNRVMGSTI
jgi:hypothetical protein